MADAKRRARDTKALLRTHYGRLGDLIEPFQSYQIVAAAGRIFAVRWPDKQPRRLPASFALYSLHWRQRRYGHQLPEWAPRLDGVFDDVDALEGELRRLRAGGDQGEAVTGVEPGLQARAGRLGVGPG